MARVWGKVARFVTAASMVGGLTLGGAAYAQFSDSFEFLEAVGKLDGTKAMDLLNDGKTNVNTKDKSTGRTALHIVVEKRNRQWVVFLLQQGANPNLADNKGVTPLMLAVSYRFVEGAEALIAGGARVDVTSDTGETPLIAAVHDQNLPIVRLLLKSGADPLRADNSGRSARDLALLIGRQNAILTEIDNTVRERAAAAANKPKVFGPTIP